MSDIVYALTTQPYYYGAEIDVNNSQSLLMSQQDIIYESKGILHSACGKGFSDTCSKGIYKRVLFYLKQWLSLFWFQALVIL